MDEKKSERFEMRLTPQELKALIELTERSGLMSRSEWVSGQIRAVAKRKKLWQ